MQNKDEIILELTRKLEVSRAMLALKEYALSLSNNRIDQLEKKDEEFRRQIKDQQNRIDELVRQLEILQQQLKELQRDRFGSKGERYVDAQQPNTILPELPIPPNQPDNVIEIAAHKRKRGGRNGLKNLPRREVIIPVSPEDRLCSCGREKQVIGYDTSEIINYEPAVYEIIVEKREKVACSCGCSITVAPKPEHILPKSKVSESFLANIIVSKILDRQPLYHLEKIFQVKLQKSN